MPVEAKIALVPKENEPNEFKGFILILNIDGVPLTIGGKDEPIEVRICSEEQLMSGFLAHPQEMVQTIDQNSSYLEEVMTYLSNHNDAERLRNMEQLE